MILKTITRTRTLKGGGFGLTAGSTGGGCRWIGLVRLSGMDSGPQLTAELGITRIWIAPANIFLVSNQAHFVYDQLHKQ